MKPLFIPEIMEQSELVSTSSNSICVYNKNNKIYCWNLYNDIMSIDANEIKKLTIDKNKIC